MCAPDSSTSRSCGWSSRRDRTILEQSTPVGSALLTALADDWGAQPAMTVSGGGTGAECEPEASALLRLSVGEADRRHPESLGEG